MSQVDPKPPHAAFALPWDDPGAPPPVDALRVARADLGDTFTVSSGQDLYVFVFSPDALRAYMSGFGPQFRGFSADPAELEKLTKSYRVVFRKASESNGDYSIDHTTLAYLLDRQGKVVDIAGYQTPPERLDAQLKALLR